MLERIEENPDSFKPLRGFSECFRVRFSNLRLIYVLKGTTIWLIIVDKRKRVYKDMLKRLK